MSKVLGIDPGTKLLGYCIYDIENNIIIDEGIVNFKNNKKHIYLLTDSEVGNIIRDAKCDYLGLEALFFRSGKNNGYTLLSGQAELITYLWLKITGKDKNTIERITPNTWKKVVGGNGRATIKEVAEILKRDYKIEPQSKTLDNIAATAIAITAASRIIK